MLKKIEKIIFDLSISASEFVSSNTCFYWERILAIRCQYVNKQSQDYRYYEILQKNCRADSCSVLDRLTCWLSISVMTFLGIKITLILQSLIQETNNIWSSSFVSKYFKFYVDFRNSEKIWANIFWFGDNYIRIRCVKQSFLLRDNTGYREPLC